MDDDWWLKNVPYICIGVVVFFIIVIIARAF